MYNLGTRVRAIPAGSAAPHQVGIGARAPPAVASQVTPSLALEMLSEDLETVPETEIFEDNEDVMFKADDIVVGVGASQR